VLFLPCCSRKEGREKLASEPFGCSPDMRRSCCFFCSHTWKKNFFHPTRYLLLLLLFPNLGSIWLLAAAAAAFLNPLLSLTLLFNEGSINPSCVFEKLLLSYGGV